MNIKTLLAATAGLSIFAFAAIAMDPPAKPDLKSVPMKKIEPLKTAEPGKGKKSEKKPEVTLKVGDKAPAVKVDKWVKGEAVSGFDSGKVYVVEFWATWCPPCIEAIPHMTELQKKHKAVTFIGVAGSERQKGDKDAKDERLEKVEAFVKKQGDKMDYRVAFDGTRAMPEAWLRPAGKNGIPCAFVVDHEGKVAWIGNPLSEADKMEETIEAALKKAAPKA